MPGEHAGRGAVGPERHGRRLGERSAPVACGGATWLRAPRHARAAGPCPLSLPCQPPLAPSPLPTSAAPAGLVRQVPSPPPALPPPPPPPPPPLPPPPFGPGRSRPRRRPRPAVGEQSVAGLLIRVVRAQARACLLSRRPGDGASVRGMGVGPARGDERAGPIARDVAGAGMRGRCDVRAGLDSPGNAGLAAGIRQAGGGGGGAEARPGLRQQCRGWVAGRRGGSRV